MSELKPKSGRLSLLELVKEVFNWYPSHYPAEERKYVKSNYVYRYVVLMSLDYSLNWTCQSLCLPVYAVSKATEMNFEIC
jgi:hypothetical protein